MNAYQYDLEILKEYNYESITDYPTYTHIEFPTNSQAEAFWDRHESEGTFDGYYTVVLFKGNDL